MKTTVILEVISIVIQMLIIFINFRTPIIIRGGYSLNFKFVLKNYMINGLIFDIIGVLLFNVILGYFEIHYPNIIIVSLLRLSRIIAI